MTRPMPSALVALITPFDHGGEIDLEAHAHNLRHLSAGGMGGFLIGGSTGEGTYLEPGERRTLLAAAREACPEAFLMVGVTAETVRAARAQLEESEGADAALVLTPTSMTRGDTPAVLRFYLALASDSALPLLLYSVPRWTAYELPEEVVHQLAGIKGIIGMKDSGGDIRRIARIIASAPHGFRLFNGASAVLGQALWSGAFGGITASGNYASHLVQRVITGRQLEDQRKLSELAAAVERGGIPSVKAAADVTGLRAGYPRAPLAPLGEGDRERVRALLQP